MVDVSHGKISCEIMLFKQVVQQINGKEVIINAGNYDGTSKGMENKACQQAFAILKEEGILSDVLSCTTDDDSSVKKYLAEESTLAHIKVL
jgi:hypothetical protein